MIQTLPTSTPMVLILEPDAILSTFIGEYLSTRGYECEIYNGIDEAIPLVARNDYSICILDVDKGESVDQDGFIRYFAHSSLPPTIVLAGKGKEAITAIDALGRGATDYMRKPFSIEELLCRIEAILRRTMKRSRQRSMRYYHFGEFTFDSLQRTLTHGETVETITTKEAELLLLLCQRDGEMLNREQALRLVWNSDNYFNARSMDVYITKLRKLMKDDPTIQILNIHGKGYRFITPGISVD